MLCVILCNIVTEAWSFGSTYVHVWPCFVTAQLTSRTGQSSVLEMHFISILNRQRLVVLQSDWVHVNTVPLMNWSQSVCFSLYDTNKAAEIWPPVSVKYTWMVFIQHLKPQIVLDSRRSSLIVTRGPRSPLVAVRSGAPPLSQPQAVQRGLTPPGAHSEGAYCSSLQGK